MAKEQGTGQHAHKSSEEHREAPTTQGDSKSSKNEESHSSTQSSGRPAGREGGSEQISNESSDLKSGEHRDKGGNIRHHTRTSEAVKGSGSEKSEER